jgi:hypothetical protein
MKNLFFVLLLIVSFTLNAQTKNAEYKKVDEKIISYSNTLNNNAISELVAFINSNFSTETDKLRAVFIWIATHFEYDVANMFTLKLYTEPQEIIDELLKNNTGVCIHFAYLFNEIGNKLGIKTFVISGYTKQNGLVDNMPHVWCASLVDSMWYLIDPTWGAGYVQNQKFIKKLNDYYFKTAPEDLIRSHIPFDPLWQFLYYPISSQDFYDGHTEINKETTFFNYIDTLKTYENKTKLEQLIATNRRIEQNGVKNEITYNQLKNNEIEIESYKNQNIVDEYNAVVYLFNEGVNKLNRFIDYRNNQFIPEKTETEIRDMVESAEKLFLTSQNKLQHLISTDKNTADSINRLKTSIIDVMIQTQEQKKFIDKYFSTAKIFRKSLFKYSGWE